MNAPHDEREYYACPLRLDGEERYILWFSGAEDGVWTEQRMVLAWSSELALRRYADARGVVAHDEKSAPYDLDQVSAFASGNVELGAREILAAWNLFVDVAVSVEAEEFLLADRAQLDLYDHLFYLSDFAPVKDTYPDPLSPEERKSARRILALGVEVLRRSLRVVGAAGAVGP